MDVFVADEFFVWAPTLRTRLGLRLGAQLPDVPCIALGHPSCGRVGVPCICVADVHWGAQLADVACVALGCPTCRRALRCVGAPNLGEVVLKSQPPRKNLFLSILQLVFQPSAPLCGRFRCVSVFRLGAHLADVPILSILQLIVLPSAPL
jgi:hypothetical protein